MSLTQPTIKTAFANAQSRSTYAQAGDSASRGKVWHLPGELEGKGFRANSVFGSYKNAPDESQPIAAFAAVQDNGATQLGVEYYDNHEESMREWVSLVERYGTPHAAYKQIQTSPATAAIVNTTTIDSTKSLNILEMVLGLQVRDFQLAALPYKIPANNLIFTVDRFTEGSVEAKVPELKEPDLISHMEERVTKVLYKNIGHIAESEEASLMHLHNTMQLRQDKTTKDMARLLNKQIGTEMETGTAKAGSDWSATSGTPPDSTNNPVSDLEPTITEIQGAGFNVDYMAMHDKPATALSTNKFIQGRGNVGTNYIDLGSKSYAIPGLPPTTVDQALTNSVAILANKEAVWLGEGPTVVASYDEEVVGYAGWLIKQWRYPYVAEPGAIRKLTGIAA